MEFLPLVLSASLELVILQSAICEQDDSSKTKQPNPESNPYKSSFQEILELNWNKSVNF